MADRQQDKADRDREREEATRQVLGLFQRDTTALAVVIIAAIVVAVIVWRAVGQLWG